LLERRKIRKPMFLKYFEKESYIYFINNILLFVIGLFYFFYSLNLSNFAEIHVDLPFLTFPIFIGEILLGFCLVLCAVKWLFLSRPKLTTWHAFLILYLSFILIKTTLGYRQFGPLAFRHAAMFYYPVFAIITYDIFKREQKWFLLKPLAISFITVSIGFFELRFYLLPYIILGFALTLSLKDKRIRYLCLAVILISLPYKALFYVSRTIIIACLITGVSLGIMFFYVLPVRKMYKFLIIGSFFSIFTTALFTLTPPLARESLLKPRQFFEIVKETDQMIKEKEATYVPWDIKPRLYNPNPYFKGRPKILSVTTPVQAAVPEPLAETPAVSSSGEGQETILAQVPGRASAEAEEKAELQGPLEQTSNLSEAVVLSALPEGKAVVQLTSASIIPSLGTLALLSVKREETVTLFLRRSEELLAETPAASSSGEGEVTVLAQAPGRAPAEAEEKAELQGPLEQTSNLSEAVVLSALPEVPGAVSEPLVETPAVSSSGEGEEMILEKIENAISLLVLEKLERVSAAQTSGPKDTPMATLWVENQMQQGKNPEGVYKYGTMLFRWYILLDMVEQLKEKKAILGFLFGKPFRSKRLEITANAFGEWSRDGWIAAHNSYIEIIYRAGFIGIVLILFLLGNVIATTGVFLKGRSIIGILIINIMIYWLSCSFFHIILEMPYFAIPFWSLYGLVLAYSHHWKDDAVIHKGAL